jgi:hypothetical protein
MLRQDYLWSEFVKNDVEYGSGRIHHFLLNDALAPFDLLLDFAADAERGMRNVKSFCAAGQSAILG